MGAFGDAFAAVEDRFLAALFDAALVSDDTWNQVQRLDVAVQETGVLDRDELVGMVGGKSYQMESGRTEQ